jgi:hypothetical protein
MDGIGSITRLSGEGCLLEDLDPTIGGSLSEIRQKPMSSCEALPVAHRSGSRRGARARPAYLSRFWRQFMASTARVRPEQRPHRGPPWLLARIHRGQVRPRAVVVAVVVLVERAAASDPAVDATPMGHTSCRLRGCAARGALRLIEQDRRGARGGGGWKEGARRGWGGERAAGGEGRQGGGCVRRELGLGLGRIAVFYTQWKRDQIHQFTDNGRK